METNGKVKAEALASIPSVEETAKDCNNIMSTAGIPAMFQAHTVCVDGDPESHGIKSLILSILSQGNASFPVGAETGPLRPSVLKYAMDSQAVLAEVQRRFSAGSTRYPFWTVETYLTKRLVSAGLVCKVKPTAKESGTGRKPRCRFYVIEREA